MINKNIDNGPDDIDNDFICGVQLGRIADAIEEILRIVKKDMEPRTKKETE